MKPSQDSDISASTLLVRRIGAEAVEPVRRLLAGGEAEAAWSDRLAERADAGGVFVLGDVTRGPGAVPVAVALFSPDRGHRTARLEHVMVSPGWRRAGLGRRLIGEATVLLNTDGMDSVEAVSGAESPAGPFLDAVGFRAGGGGVMVYRG